MPNPAVSIIIPTKNRIPLLSEALESVSLQSFKNFEIIVVNDGGTDPAGEIVHFSKDFKLKIINQKGSKGCASARNKGIEVSKGKYLAFLDDDDLWLPGHLENLFFFLEENNKISLAYSDCEVQRIKENGKVIESKGLGVNFNIQDMLENDFIPPSSIILRKNCLKETGFFDESMGYSEDWDFLLKCASKFNMTRVPVTSTIIRLRNDASNHSSKINEERIRCLKLIQKRYNTAELDVKTFWEVACHYEKKL